MTKARKTIVLVDGSSYLFRAYHALPPLLNSKQQPTGAVYGVINMLRRLLKDEMPDYMAVVFDTKEKTFRHKKYKEYKANRPEMPDELAVQIKPLHELIKAMGFPLIAVPGFEADDVIGTLAQEAEKQHMKVVISTGDKDLAQLVTPHITLVNTMTNTLLDEQGVEEKFGVTPAQIIDYLALVGDTSDNIPGIPKVGPKTAVKWLQEYKTLDNLVEHAEDISGKVGENLRTHLKDLELSKELVTIVTDLKLDLTPEELTLKPQDNELLREMFTELEFKTWLKDIEATKPAPKTQAIRYQSITELKALKDLLQQAEKAKRLSFDLETTSLNTMQAEIVGIALSVEVHQAFYIPVGHDTEGPQLDLKEVLKHLGPVLQNSTIKKVGQNLKYDLEVMLNYDIKAEGVAFDTMLESYVLNSVLRHDMDSLAKHYLSYDTKTYEDVAGKGAKQIPFAQVSIEDATFYSSEDADITLQLHETLWPKLQQEPKLLKVYQEIELPLMEVLIHMERAGVKIDADLLKQQSHDIEKRLGVLEEQAYTLAGEEFNLGSPKQLQQILFEKLELPVLEKTPKGAPSTAESVLVELSHDYELPQVILEHRSLSKLKSTYTDKLPLVIDPKTHRVHTSYHQAVAATGRLSSTDPNLQNIPIRTEEGRKIRKAFIAEKDHVLLSADYSQIELRIMAHLSDDPELIKAFEQGEDIHRYTASQIFNVGLDEVSSDQRRSAKAINFGLMYGMSAFGLARQIDSSREEAQVFMEVYFERYPGVKNYMEKTRQQASKQGYVETIDGRRLYLPDINTKNVPRRRAAERAAINAPLQGSSADLIKKSMINIYQWMQSLDVEIKMIMQVHDELVFELPKSFAEEASKKIKTLMESAGNFKVPLEVSVGMGLNWEEAH